MARSTAATHGRRIQRSLIAAVVVPVAYAGSMGTTGVPRAEGCAGTGPTLDVGWEEIRPSLYDDVGSSVPASADGFHYAVGEYYNMETADALAGLTLEVRDGSDQVVPGALFMIREEYTEDWIRAWVGWQAAANLSAGTYSATLSALTLSGPYSASYLLVVTDVPPTELSPFSAAIHDWTLEERDASPFVDCVADWYCQVNDSVGLNTAHYVRADFEVVVPPITGTVLWEYGVTAAAAPTLYSSPDTVVSWNGPKFGSVTFGQKLASYCVILHARDLVTGDTAAAEVCFPPGKPTSTEVATSACVCAPPVPDELLPRWCKECGSPLDPACAALTADAGAEAGEPDAGETPDAQTDPDGSDAGEADHAEVGGGSGGDTGADTTGAETGAAARTESADGPAGTGCGCVTACHDARRGGLFALVCAALLATLTRRRMRF